MTVVADFLPEVLPECPTCPRPIAERAVINALREFCEKTELIRAAHAPINSVIDQRDYTLTEPADHKIVTVYEFRYDNTPYDPRSENWLDLHTLNWREGGHGFAWHLPTPTLLRLTWDPTEALVGGIELSLVLKPTLTPATVNQLLLDDWNEEIAAGAKYRLMRMPGKKWTSLAGAELNASIFRKGISEGKWTLEKSHTRQDVAVTHRPIATGSRNFNRI